MLALRGAKQIPNMMAMAPLVCFNAIRRRIEKLTQPFKSVRFARIDLDGWFPFDDWRALPGLACL
jgi:endogenous inhibitor of DNA gyrase (YacG/DUF329 family)